MKSHVTSVQTLWDLSPHLWRSPPPSLVNLVQISRVFGPQIVSSLPPRLTWSHAKSHVVLAQISRDLFCQASRDLAWSRPVYHKFSSPRPCKMSVKISCDLDLHLTRSPIASLTKSLNLTWFQPASHEISIKPCEILVHISCNLSLQIMRFPLPSLMRSQSKYPMISPCNLRDLLPQALWNLCPNLVWPQPASWPPPSLARYQSKTCIILAPILQYLLCQASEDLSQILYGLGWHPKRFPPPSLPRYQSILHVLGQHLRTSPQPSLVISQSKYHGNSAHTLRDLLCQASQDLSPNLTWFWLLSQSIPLQSLARYSAKSHVILASNFWGLLWIALWDFSQNLPWSWPPNGEISSTKPEISLQISQNLSPNLSRSQSQCREISSQTPRAWSKSLEVSSYSCISSF